MNIKTSTDTHPQMELNFDADADADAVNSPTHYHVWGNVTQAIDIIKATLTKEEYVGYLKGNVLKYRLRAGKKGNTQQDIDKADWYANTLVELS